MQTDALAYIEWRKLVDANPAFDKPMEIAFHAGWRAALASIPPADLAGMDGLVEAVAELQLAAFLAGRGSTRADGPAPSIDDFRRMAATAIQSLLAQVARLEGENKQLRDKMTDMMPIAGGSPLKVKSGSVSARAALENKP